METVTRILAATLLATLLMAAAPLLRSGSQACAASTFAEELRLTGDKGERDDKVAFLAGESSLSRALDLPAPEFFATDEPERDSGDFELRMPEENLPDSDIPLTLNSKVEYFINYFQANCRDVFARWLSRSERYIPTMKQVLKKEGLPEDLVYLAMIESGFSPRAYSSASAVGPWQFMSGTGRRYALRIDQWIDERRDPLKSTVAAAMYLKELYGMFNKDWYLAAAGYNAGENKILRAIELYNSRDFWQLSKGSYLKRETKDYVPRLLAAAIIAKDPAKYGFADVAYLAPIELDTVTVPDRTDLELVARICDVPYQAIRDLNPELRRWCTPPDYPNYELKIPKGKKALFEAEYAKIPADRRYTEKVLYTRYKAAKRDTLASVARRFGTTPGTLAELNHIGAKSRLKGRLLTVPVKPQQERVAETDTPSGKDGEGSGEFTRYYTVKRGDTLASLARRFNVSAKILTAWNNLKGRLALRPGKRIIVAKYEKRGGMTPENS
ncbi:MAG TPA: transglycosylase SLT domain-containing protein [Geobacteraceae bacterium]